MINQKIKIYCQARSIKVKELAKVANVSEKTIYNFINGGDIKSGSIEAWAKEWPEMICYALDLKCDKQEIEHEQEKEQESIDKRVSKLEEIIREHSTAFSQFLKNFENQDHEKTDFYPEPKFNNQKSDKSQKESEK